MFFGLSFPKLKNADTLTPLEGPRLAQRPAKCERTEGSMDTAARAGSTREEGAAARAETARWATTGLQAIAAMAIGRGDCAGSRGD